MNVDLVEVHAVCQLVTELISAIPRIFGNIFSNMNGPQLISEYFPDHSAGNRQNADAKILRNFCSCKGEHKLGGGGERVGPVHHRRHRGFVDYLKSDQVIQLP